MIKGRYILKTQDWFNRLWSIHDIRLPGMIYHSDMGGSTVVELLNKQDNENEKLRNEILILSRRLECYIQDLDYRDSKVEYLLQENSDLIDRLHNDTISTDMELASQAAEIERLKNLLQESRDQYKRLAFDFDEVAGELAEFKRKQKASE